MTQVMVPAQMLRFGVVGVVSNLLLFLFYLALTSAGLGHKLAMSLAYLAGVLQGFFLQRSWTFRHRGLVGRSLARYVVAYAVGFALNYTALIWLVDGLGFPHAWVQAAAVFCLAAVFFLLQKYWIFGDGRASSI